MANDLEQQRTLEARRRAIADALRAIMAEPLPSPAAALPSPGAAIPPAAMAPATALVDPVDPVDAAAEHARHVLEDRLLTEEWDDEEFTERADSMVPPLETVGSMSRRASLALFGHA
jgi:hypothetical protein